MKAKAEHHMGMIKSQFGSVKAHFLGREALTITCSIGAQSEWFPAASSERCCRMGDLFVH